jgi:hypothetical protein
MSGLEWLRAKRNGLAREFAWPLVANLFKLLPTCPVLSSLWGKWTF